jgi:hypothetical protein
MIPLKDTLGEEDLHTYECGWVDWVIGFQFKTSLESYAKLLKTKLKLWGS